MGELLRVGTPVIISNSDRPESRMVAVLTSFNDTSGKWNARYLSPKTNMARCWTMYRPTPLIEFGVTLEMRSMEYRCIQNKESCAVYHDGAPRPWQDDDAERWWEMRPIAREVLLMWNEIRDAGDVIVISDAEAVQGRR